MNWIAHSGDDYTVVMRDSETTDTATVRVFGDDAAEISETIAMALNDWPWPVVTGFKPTKPGLKAQIAEDRSVTLHMGEVDGEERWVLKMVNQGHETRLCLSADALDAIVTIYCELSADVAEPPEQA
ncbi:hypothetical protein [Rhizorhabdus sp.]|uniref:hypothetical protein n=1 Tax=Rhizorhabdus sp. TaxID=1968843 RepID=UPI0035ADC3E6